MLDVRQDQFLVLALVLDSELDDARIQPGRRIGTEQPENPVIDVSPVFEHLVERRSGQQTALGAGVLIADRVVVGIEQDSEVGMKRTEPRCRSLQHHGFEKPAGVGEVPLRRAGIRHRLSAAVFRIQR